MVSEKESDVTKSFWKGKGHEFVLYRYVDKITQIQKYSTKSDLPFNMNTHNLSSFITIVVDNLTLQIYTEFVFINAW